MSLMNLHSKAAVLDYFAMRLRYVATECVLLAGTLQDILKLSIRLNKHTLSLSLPTVYTQSSAGKHNTLLEHTILCWETQHTVPNTQRTAGTYSTNTQHAVGNTQHTA